MLMTFEELQEHGLSLAFADASFNSYGQQRITIQFDHNAPGIDKQPRFEAIVRNVDDVERIMRIEDAKKRQEQLYLGVALKLEPKIIEYLDQLEHENH
jgi:hypothetical protein